MWRGTVLAQFYADIYAAFTNLMLSQIYGNGKTTIYKVGGTP